MVEGCIEKFKISRDWKDYMVRMYLYFVDFWFDKLKKSRSLVLVEVLGDSGEWLEGEVMEICFEFVVVFFVLVGERWIYSYRIFFIICFG